MVPREGLSNWHRRGEEGQRREERKGEQHEGAKQRGKEVLYLNTNFEGIVSDSESGRRGRDRSVKETHRWVKAQEGWREGKMNRIRENSSAMASKTRMQVQLLSMICKGREEEAKDQSVRRGKWRGRGGRTISTSNLSSSERKIASSNCQREGESEKGGKKTEWERWEYWLDSFSFVWKRRILQSQWGCWPTGRSTEDSCEFGTGSTRRDLIIQETALGMATTSRAESLWVICSSGKRMWEELEGGGRGERDLKEGCGRRECTCGIERNQFLWEATRTRCPEKAKERGEVRERMTEGGEVDRRRGEGYLFGGIVGRFRGDESSKRRGRWWVEGTTVNGEQSSEEEGGETWIPQEVPRFQCQVIPEQGLRPLSSRELHEKRDQDFWQILSKRLVRNWSVGLSSVTKSGKEEGWGAGWGKDTYLIKELPLCRDGVVGMHVAMTTVCLFFTTLFLVLSSSSSGSSQIFLFEFLAIRSVSNLGRFRLSFVFVLTLSLLHSTRIERRGKRGKEKQVREQWGVRSTEERGGGGRSGVGRDRWVVTPLLHLNLSYRSTEAFFGLLLNSVGEEVSEVHKKVGMIRKQGGDLV
jgi:hypothetical protein